MREKTKGRKRNKMMALVEIIMRRKKNGGAGREALLCGVPDSFSNYFTYFT
jgi:hypothetical protein